MDFAHLERIPRINSGSTAIATAEPRRERLISARHALMFQEPAVSFGSSQDAKEQVRQAIDIVDLVGKYVQLRRQGRNYVALCPWHDDSRPSLQVNPERQSFRCWVCDVGGDIFSFLMKMEGVTFPEALAMLADQAGITIQSSDRPGGQDSRGQAGDKRFLLQAMDWAQKQYHECLLAQDEAEPARRYLAERGVTPESIEQFCLGYSPNHWDWLLSRARPAGYSAEVLEAVGLLLRSSDSRSVYDRFRGRVLFSIRDLQGRAVGMGGRVLPESGSTSPAKYLNSPETPLFAKHRLLYGFDVAREAIRKSRTALVMEGYTDCIIAHQFGFNNAVAVLGTALGSHHIQILKRFVDRIVLVLDGDEAGQRRAGEVLELFVSQNVDLQIVTLPDEMDPCEFLLERGADPFAEILAHQATDALEHAFRLETQGLDLERDVHGASQALDRLVGVVAKAPRLRGDTSDDARFREEKILQRLAGRFRVPETQVRERLTGLRRAGEGRRASQAVSQDPAAEPAEGADYRGKASPFEWELLSLLIRHGQCVPAAYAAISADDLETPWCRKLYTVMCRMLDEGKEPSFDRLMLEFDAPAAKRLLVELDESAADKGVASAESLLEKLIERNRNRQQVKSHPANTEVLREKRLDDQQAIELIRQIVEKERGRHGISEPTDG